MNNLENKVKFRLTQEENHRRISAVASNNMKKIQLFLRLIQISYLEIFLFYFLKNIFLLCAGNISGPKGVIDESR